MHTMTFFTGMPYLYNGGMSSGGDITTLDTSSSRKWKECKAPGAVNDTDVSKNYKPLADGDER